MGGASLHRCGSSGAARLYIGCAIGTPSDVEFLIRSGSQSISCLAKGDGRRLCTLAPPLDTALNIGCNTDTFWAAEVAGVFWVLTSTHTAVADITACLDKWRRWGGASHRLRDQRTLVGGAVFRPPRRWLLMPLREQ